MGDAVGAAVGDIVLCSIGCDAVAVAFAIARSARSARSVVILRMTLEESNNRIIE
jgi:hypothetical protein